MNTSPMLKACGLWEKTSGARNTYFVGRSGGGRALVPVNWNQGVLGEPYYHIMHVQVPDGPRQSRDHQTGAQVEPSSSATSVAAGRSQVSKQPESAATPNDTYGKSSRNQLPAPT